MYISNATLTQEMADAWCAKRDTEANRSHGTRTQVVRMFVDYLRHRELTDITPPATFRPESRIRAP